MLYTVNQSTDDLRELLLYEQYYDRSGYEAHMTTAEVKENILGKVVPMLRAASAISTK